MAQQHASTVGLLVLVVLYANAAGSGAAGRRAIELDAAATWPHPSVGVGGVSGGSSSRLLIDYGAPAAIELDAENTWPHTSMGVGGVSGGGATSRLLVDYEPSGVRSEILDILFKPQFMLSLQHLKVEGPGADSDTTNGAEPSFMHSADDQPNVLRGYEAFLMTEAKRRNPTIQLSALQWGAPGYVGDKGPTGWKRGLYTERGVEHVIAWLRALKSQANVTLDYFSGGHNEQAPNATYIKQLRAQMDAAGFEDVKLLAFDTIGWWNAEHNLTTDAALLAAIDGITTHCQGHLHGSVGPSKAITELGVPLIGSEEHIGMPDPNAVPASSWEASQHWAVSLGRNFINNKEVGSWLWSLIYSWYGGIVYDGKGYLTGAASSVLGHAPMLTSADLGPPLLLQPTRRGPATTRSLPSCTSPCSTRSSITSAGGTSTHPLSFRQRTLRTSTASTPRHRRIAPTRTGSPISLPAWRARRPSSRWFRRAERTSRSLWRQPQCVYI